MRLATYVFMFLWVLFPAKVVGLTCGDDPRIMDNPAGLVANPGSETVKMLPQTFITLQPAIRKALGKNMVICPAIPINSKGSPVTKLKLPFPEIWDALELAVNASDWKQARLIADSVTPLPLPPEALFSLLSIPVWNEEHMAKLADILGIAPHVFNWRYFVLDVFQALGGKSTAKARVGVSNNYAELAQARTRAKALDRTGLFMPYSSANFKEAAESLRRLGVEMVPVRKFFD